ncbi:MAG: valine--tRNA ligase [Zetaproteobacteria bacterium CG06_land_8_20_14_3_00_59_53]|nr:MAG: valine--tRNA ligase [Zetaproteobacteria bacterium CG2_30_59_37]PIO90917.1 MAG: valine--tRNA ligase [Zetaproteobacteria bacterium CG23_combo_of_CG06-09_8_20_14_all_59_86]PIQ64113.1 MAG: valine--tRNA ligase [Zetaproteobacteria bacterium CG11_big_fil_rev_8_21_14_0_20_59_439]PIU71099.1 MAG: valine--tRNA ligase [Zetaproteobacteria bacterium CG06_land_8_20_14_3_00_59_53]PIU96092.1 MAG: valine--tRNA ligase [Zetaproteobacteria bacterium CG03_land_8_20_14_0_80_59_51]PIY46359.1 MAG: valine--tRNA
MSEQAPELVKAFEPHAMEEAISEQWLQSDAFQPKEGDESYCIVIPPPNVTGTLHMGHAFSYTMQDILIRWQRMKGKSTLWQPGTDHAGIATQMVVERLLDKEGLHRRDMGRERFLDRVWEWKEHSGGTIVGQLKRLGCSCDWSRERFTLDEGLSEAVREVFVRLYEEGLIYRGKRLVNWDPVLETAVSDLEVQHEEENGHLWHMCYPLVDDPSKHIIVATTRPETMFGDAAVAVHPEDERYQDLIGKQVQLPLTDRTIPVIADEYVDRAFGTGCVKITPAHDFNDYEVGKRHALPLINILTPRAHMVDEETVPEKYHGMERYEARENVVADLDAAGLLYKIDEHTHQVGRGDRSHAILEPYLTDQWYVKIQPLADPAIKAVEDGDIRFVPQHWEKTYFEWMRNIQDWCISRQLWWGHRIPAWYCGDCEHITVSRTTPERCEGCGGTHIRQDEDVLDTWFSSGLWPFSTLGWPNDTKELESFYPTNVLVTGFDIIFFWVARMIMMGMKFTGKVPFRDVYIHALIRDASGQKMSKSKGNVVDPLEMVEQYGSDALRFTLAHMATPGRDVKLDVERIGSNRNFMNKIWNAARFVFMNRGDASPAGDFVPTSDINRWVLFELDTCAREVDQALVEYRFNEAASSLYAFVWGVYCDWYVEAAKVALYGEDEAAKLETQITMLTALDGWLRLLHPICPFISEALWQTLHGESARLVSSTWVAGSWNSPEFASAAGSMRHVMQVVSGIRSIRGEMNISPARKLAASVACDAVLQADLAAHEDTIRALARLESLAWLPRDTELEGAAVAPLDGATVYVPLAGLVDVEEELARLDKAQAKLAKEIDKMAGRLSNPKYRDNAPAEVVEKAELELDGLRTRQGEIEAAIQRMHALKKATQAGK